jgi:Zn-dependent oligopeptidase
MNPLLAKFTTKFQSVPFDKIKNEHFIPGLKEAIQIAKGQIEEIKQNPQKPNFENVILAFELSSEKVDSISSIFFNLYSAETNDELSKLAKDFSPLLTEFGNDLILDQKLFEKVKAVYEQMEFLNLSTEERTLLTKRYREFVRNGALLSEDQKIELREIDNELSKLTVGFSEHILAETNNFEMVLSEKEETEGLPESFLEAAALAAKEKGLENKWLITLDFPSYGPFMTYSSRRDLRKKLFIAYGSRAFKSGPNDNRDIVKKISSLRFKRASLLGFKNHSDYVLQERMAENSNRVLGFLKELIDFSKPAALKEIKDLTDFAKRNGGPEILEAWDFSYWLEKFKQEKFDLSDEMLRPYFKLENVLNGVFAVAKKLYGIEYKKIEGVPVYHKDVEVFEVMDSKGAYLGLFYTDFFPRPGKRNGAWMTSFKNQKKIEGIDHRPHISIVCNFTKPTPTKPSLLNFNEVTTLFHEFGHSLHGMLSDCNFESISGTNVYWDFVELPSQIMENWAYEKECLDLFAKHYETGEKIPDDLVKKIKESSNFFEGLASLRQNGLALIDMAWHMDDPSNIENVEKFEKEVTSETRIFPEVPGVNTSVSFSHIFAGGYSAGYYSYKWAEVLDADAFELFQEEGIFNPLVAQKFKEEILSKGGSNHPSKLYEKFRGRQPSIKALLKRGGLLVSKV